MVGGRRAESSCSERSSKREGFCSSRGDWRAVTNSMMGGLEGPFGLSLSFVGCVGGFRDAVSWCLGTGLSGACGMELPPGAELGCARTGKPLGGPEVECSSGPRWKNRRRTPIQRPTSALGTHSQMRSSRELLHQETTERHRADVAYFLHFNPPVRPARNSFPPNVLPEAHDRPLVPHASRNPTMTL